MTKSCRKCGRKVEEFFESGLLGCPYCYGAFKEEITEYLKKAQGSLVHNGKAPLAYGGDKVLISKYKELLAVKEQAILERQFDEACALGEELKKLAAELEKRGLK